MINILLNLKNSPPVSSEKKQKNRLTAGLRESETIKVSQYFKTILLFFTVFFATNSLFAQPTQVEGAWVTGTFNNNIGSVAARTAINGTTILAYRNRSTATSATRTLLFNNPSDNYNPKWVANNATPLAKNTRLSGGAVRFTSGGTDINFVTVQNSYYTFIIGNSGSTNNDLAIWETSYNPTTISSVSRNFSTVDATQSPTITVTMANALGTNERVYVYYSTDNFATSGNSAFVQLSALNGSFQGTASIPTFTAGTTVTYYVLTTANTTPIFADVQYQSLNIFNGTAQNTTAANFSYTVTAAGAPSIVLGTTSGTYNVAVNGTSGVQTSTVTGTNLTANITATAPTYYEVSSDGTTWGSTATFTQSGGNVSGTLSIRYKPTNSENAVAKTITLASTGATTQNYTATGTAPAVISASPTSATYSANVGATSASQSFSVTGSFLSANITATAPAFYQVSTDNTSWSVTGGSVTFTPSSGSVSATLYVRYVPTGAETSVAKTVALTSTNSNTQNITVTGTAVQPLINISPSTATFTANVGGTSASQTFTISGSNLNTDITVTAPAYYQVSKDNSSWSATGGSVTYTQSGGTVSSTNLYVRYVPTGGENAAVKNVNLTSTGATTKTIAATGTATYTITVQFQQPGDWSGSGYLYAFNGGTLNPTGLGTWPGLIMTSLGSGWWTYTFTYTNSTVDIVFNNGNGNGKQTVNIIGVNSSRCYTLTGTGTNYGASLTTCPSGPTIGVTPTTATYSTTVGGTSGSQTFAVSGSFLTADIVVTAPAYYQVSKDNSSWSATGGSVTYTQSGGTVSSTNLFVRYVPTGAESAVAKSVTLTSTGATTQNITVTGTTSSLKVSNAVTGLWTDGSSWVGGVAPSTIDVVQIVNGANITINTNFTQTGAITVDAGGKLTATSPFVTNTSVAINGTFTIGGNLAGGASPTVTGSGTWTYGSASTLEFRSTNVYHYNTNNDLSWPVTNGPFNVSLISATTNQNGLQINNNLARTINGTLLVQNTVNLYKNGSGGYTVNGTVQINTGGVFSNPVVTYGASSTLLFNTGTTVTSMSGPWVTGTGGPGAGLPANVQISNNTTLTIPNNANYTVKGNLTIDSGSAVNTPSANALTVSGSVLNSGTLTLGGSANGDINVGGNWTNSGTFTHNSRTVTFNGTGNQTVSKTGGESFQNLVVNKASGNVLLATSTNVTVSNTLALSAGEFVSGSNTLTLNGTITRIAGTLTTDNSSLVFGPNVAALTLPNSVFTSSPSSLVNLTVNRAGGITLGNQGITASGTLTLTDGIVTIGSNTLTLNGTITRIAGTLTTDNSSLVFGPNVAALTLPNSVFTSSPSSLVNLTVNRAGGITLGNQGITASGTLTLTDGIVTTGSNIVSLTRSNASPISGGNSSTYINGKLEITYPATGTNIARTFPVGKGGNYRPVTFSYDTAPASRTVLIEQFEAAFPGGVPSSATQFGTRYWNITQSSTGGSYKVTLDAGGATSSSSIVILRREGASASTSNASDVPNYTNVTSFVTTNVSNDVALGACATCTALAPAFRGITLFDLNSQMSAIAVSGASTYRYEIKNLTTNVTTVFNSSSRSFNLTQLAAGTPAQIVAYNTVYAIRVGVNNGGFIYGTSYNVTTIPTVRITKLTNKQCGTTLPRLDEPIYSDQVYNANKFRFIVNGGSIVNQEIDSWVPFFNLTQLVGTIDYDTVYTIRVKASTDRGVTWPTAYGSACTVTTPDTPPTSRIVSPACGSTLASLGTFLYAQAVYGATHYRYEVNGGIFPPRTFISTIVSPRGELRLTSLVGGAEYSTLYTVRVAISFDNGLTYESYGRPCSFTTPAAPIARMSDSALTNVFEVKAFPNPFARHFSLDIQSSSDDLIQVKVYDMIGRELEVQKATVSELSTKEIGTNYPSGVYNVIVSQGDKVRSVRMIKR